MRMISNGDAAQRIASAMDAMNGLRMAELLAIMCVCALGIFAAEAFIFAHETSHERRARRNVERLINRKYPPTF